MSTDDDALDELLEHLKRSRGFDFTGYKPTSLRRRIDARMRTVEVADYASYVACQDQVSAAWQDKDSWTRMSILNTARSGKFSSDRAIAEYCNDIWSVWPLTVTI